MPLIAFLPIIIFLAECHPAAACSLSQSCGEMWVAAQDVGKERAFFDKDNRSLKAADVQIGNVVTANRDINVRSRPANWRDTVFTLKRGQTVVVADLRTLSISGGRSQIWIRIEASPDQQAGTSQPPMDPQRDLIARKRFWQDQVFYCKSGADIYPSKNDNTYDPMRRYDRRIPKQIWEKDYISESGCDDGDMTFFNGLLCAAGDRRGCSGVAIAQERTGSEDRIGRWWRSKRLINESDTPDHASFSTEQGLGAFNYLTKTADRNAFKRWLAWIAQNPQTYAPLPHYCPHKECVFKLIDCPLLVTIASRFGSTFEALSVCNPLQYIKIPTPEQVEQRLENELDNLADAASRFEAAVNHLVNQLGQAVGLPDIGDLLPTPIAVLRQQGRTLTNAFKDAREQLLGPQIGEAAAQLAQSIALLNSVVNGVEIKDADMKFDSGTIELKTGGVSIEGPRVTVRGTVNYNPNGEHIAAVEVFLLRNLGYQSDELKDAAAIIYERDKDNPFFEYLARGRTDRMLQLILDKCPSIQRPSVRRFQWFPERGEDLQGDTNKPAWAESMYWDCLFLSELYEHDVESALGRNVGLNPFAILGNALREAIRFLSDVKNSVAQIDEEIRRINRRLTSAIPGAGDYCEHNWCPPILPPLDPGGGSGGGYCAHNWCPPVPGLPVPGLPVPGGLPFP